MKLKRLTYYLRNCFLLIIPVLVWNVIFTEYLPEKLSNSIFDKDIPLVIYFSEILSGLIIIILPIFMPLVIKTKIQKLGLMFYGVGLALYLLAWRSLILFPNSLWSDSFIGFTSLAYSPLVLLVGIGLIGSKLFFNIRYNQMIYIITAGLFIVIRTLHLTLVFN